MDGQPTKEEEETSMNDKNNSSSNNISSSSSSENERTTKVIHCRKHGEGAPPYVRCSSSFDFEMPLDADHHQDDDAASGVESQVFLTTHSQTTSRSSTPLLTKQVGKERRRRSSLEVNQTLNLNLGLPHLIQQQLHHVRKLGKVISWIFSFIEHWIFVFWDKLPLRLRQKLTMIGWKLYLPLHRYLLGNRTGIHPSSSPEYHALTTLMWWGRLFPTSVRRIRFALSQMAVWHPPEAYPPIVSSSEHNRRQCHYRPRQEEDMDVEGGILRRQTRRHMCDHDDTYYKEGEMDQKGQILYVKKTWGIHAQILEIRFDMRQHKQQQQHININANGENKNENINNDEEDNGDDDDDDDIVTGYYIQHNPDKPSDQVLFWIYGGAFLGGDAKGNLALAEKMGHYSNSMDVFLPDYRLLPEYELHHAIHDIALSYEYLIHVRNVHPKNVTCLGISSGAGLITILLQNLADAKTVSLQEKKEEENVNETLNSEAKGSNLDKGESCTSWKENEMMPSGAVLIGPFVDYTEPEGSMKDYVAHDLIVTQSVLETGLPYLDAQGDHEKRKSISPVYQSFIGLPPLCVVVSEHEAVYDQTIMLVNRARADGVSVVLGVWKYMCHVFPVLCAFLPESRQSVDFMCNWIKDH